MQYTQQPKLCNGVNGSKELPKTTPSSVLKWFLMRQPRSLRKPKCNYK